VKRLSIHRYSVAGLLLTICFLCQSMVLGGDAVGKKWMYSHRAFETRCVSFYANGSSIPFNSKGVLSS
jgi:hypothetical protein